MVDAPAKTEPTRTGAALRRRQRLATALFRPVDGAGLAYFRIVFGLVLAWEGWRLLEGGWVDRYFVQPEFHFTYWPFDWLTPMPGASMRLLYLLLALAGLLMAAGLFYRLSVLFLAVGFTYTFLLDKTNYLNHMYLVCLLLLLCLFLPANRVWSLDARLRKPPTEQVPAWTIWLLRFQIGVPYVFGGIAKLNPDWMFRAEPLRTWLASDTDFPLIGRFFTDEPVVLAMNYGALLLDLGVVFALLNKRTRLFGYIAAVGFHLMNSRLFTLGIFPWLMIAATMIFFPPDWPRRVLEDLQLRRRPHVWLAGAGAGAGALVGAFLPPDVVPMQVAIGALGLGLIAYWGAEQCAGRAAAPANDTPPAPPAGGRRQRLVL
ncbi:MAG: HTTM domain-containing protein, partial [Actinomycetota bacterium]